MNQIVQSVQGCRVDPLPPEVVTKSDYRADYDDYGTTANFAWVGVCILSFILLANIEEELPGLIWFAPFIVSFFARYWLIYTLKDRDAEKYRDRTNQTNRERSIKEAERVTNCAINYVSSAIEQVDSLNTNMCRASQLIEQADYEFRQNAYSPFWDKVHASIAQLARCQVNIECLKDYARLYSEALEGRQHNFPVYPVGLNLVPDITRVSQDLQRVIRQGQTNFQFSSIYEQRRTREVMVAGFKSLGEAVDNFGASIDQSFAHFVSELNAVMRQTNHR